MIGFAVIGLGGMGRTHLSSLARHGQAEVVAVHDSDRRRVAGSLAPAGVNLETGAKPWDESSVRRCAAPSAPGVSAPGAPVARLHPATARGCPKPRQGRHSGPER